MIGLRYLQTAVHNSAKDPDGDSQGWLIKRLSKKETKKDWREDRDVESGDAEDAGEDVGEDAGSGSGSGSGSYVDSFDSDSFESDEDAGGGGVQHVQGEFVLFSNRRKVTMKTIIITVIFIHYFFNTVAII